MLAKSAPYTKNYHWFTRETVLVLKYTFRIIERSQENAEQQNVRHQREKKTHGQNGERQNVNHVTCRITYYL